MGRWCRDLDNYYLITRVLHSNNNTACTALCDSNFTSINTWTCTVVLYISEHDMVSE